MNEINNPNKPYILLIGQTTQEKSFRPSDWADRLTGAVKASIASEELEDIISLISVVQYKGIKSLLIDKELEKSVPIIYRFINKFAEENNLQIIQVMRNEI